MLQHTLSKLLRPWCVITYVLYTAKAAAARGEERGGIDELIQHLLSPEHSFLSAHACQVGRRNDLRSQHRCTPFRDQKGSFYDTSYKKTKRNHIFVHGL